MTEKLYTNEEYGQIVMDDARSAYTKYRLDDYGNPDGPAMRSLDEWGELYDDHTAVRRKEAGIE